MKTTFTIQCRTCQSTKQSEYCDVCGHETRSHDYVENITEEFVRGLWHELEPHRYKVVYDHLVWRMESFGQDPDGSYFIEIAREDEVENILKIYPKEN